MTSDEDSVTPRDSTIYEVAERAGVSISTVSLAINQPERVRTSTRDRIFAVIDEVGFVPKERAVMRARSGVGRIAVVAPFTSYPAYLRRLGGILSEVEGDTQVIVYDHEDVAVSHSPLLSAMPLKGHVDGVIVMDMPLDEKIADRLRARLPTVLVGVDLEGFPGVHVDDFQGGRLAGEMLSSRGHRRVAFVRETQVNFFPTSPTQHRFEGLVSVFGKDNVIDVTVSRDESGGTDAVQQLFGGPDRSTWPTAVFATRDLVAIRVLYAAQRFGLRVPADLSIVGFDDDPVAEAIGLTTVRNPLEETGAVAVRVLNQLIHGDQPPRQLLPVSLIERVTAGPPERDPRNHR
jgi:DNA-binding LacI/PurR family transcriptional regulator